MKINQRISLALPALLMVVLFSSKVFAEAELPSKSGNAFARLCSGIEKNEKDITETDIQNAAACVSYVEGFIQGVEADSYDRAQNKTPSHLPFCLPTDAENGQIIRVMLKFIHDHPERAHYKTFSIMMTALQEAFPCK